MKTQLLVACAVPVVFLGGTPHASADGLGLGNTPIGKFIQWAANCDAECLGKAATKIHDDFRDSASQKAEEGFKYVFGDRMDEVRKAGKEDYTNQKKAVGVFSKIDDPKAYLEEERMLAEDRQEWVKQNLLPKPLRELDDYIKNAQGPGQWLDERLEQAGQSVESYLASAHDSALDWRDSVLDSIRPAHPESQPATSGDTGQPPGSGNILDSIHGVTEDAIRASDAARAGQAGSRAIEGQNVLQATERGSQAVGSTRPSVGEIMLNAAGTLGGAMASGVAERDAARAAERAASHPGPVVTGPSVVNQPARPGPATPSATGSSCGAQVGPGTNVDDYCGRWITLR